MALNPKNRAAGLSITTGTGSYAVVSTPTGNQSLANIGNGNTFPGRVTDGINWEAGIYTLTTGPLTVARTLILDSSNAGAAVNWGPGTREIVCTPLAERTALTDADNTFTGINTFGVLNVTGAFTSVGIDDNASAESLQLGNISMEVGQAGSAFTVRRNVDDQQLIVSGSSTSGQGSRLVLFGQAHATLAGDFQLQDLNATGKVAWDESASTLSLGSAAADKLTINAETVSKPNIPCFFAWNAATDANVTGAAAGPTVDFSSEQFDQSGDFAADTFTAPASGKYLLTAQVRFEDLTLAMSQFNIQIVTSNETHSTTSNEHIETAGDGVTVCLTTIALMDAADTASVVGVVSGGAGNTADIFGSATPLTFFSGLRVA